MTQQAVESIIGKTVMDGTFREALFANPNEALADYSLTGEEMAALKSVDAEILESFAGALDDRISKSLMRFAYDSDSLGIGDATEGGIPKYIPVGAIRFQR